MNEKNTWRYQQRKCNPNCRPTKETMSSQRLRTYHSFLRTNIHIYEKCRHTSFSRKSLTNLFILMLPYSIGV